MTLTRAWLLLAACLLTPITTASANVVTDWDEKAVAFIQPRMVPPVAYRAMAILHIAMFDALNSIEPRYRPYYAQLPATQVTSKDAAAAAAAWPVVAMAQSADRRPVVGYLVETTKKAHASRIAAFQEGMRDLGYVEGQNIEVAYRFGNFDRAVVPALAPPAPTPQCARSLRGRGHLAARSRLGRPPGSASGRPARFLPCCSRWQRPPSCRRLRQSPRCHGADPHGFGSEDRPRRRPWWRVALTPEPIRPAFPSIHRPLGRAKLLANPALIGSMSSAQTIGVAGAALFTTSTAMGSAAKIT